MTEPEMDGDDADEVFDPEAKKTDSSRMWLKMLQDADKAGQGDYNDRCDNIDKLYASIDRLANSVRDREFQIFWSNVQVLGPSIYSRPPVPVVTTRPWVRGELERTTADLLERAAMVGFELDDIDSVMRLVRDDLTVLSRGVVRVRYEAAEKDNNFTEKLCFDHVNRREFRHDPARTWKETDWVAFGAWLTKSEMRKRFRKASGDAYREASYSVRKDEQNADDGKQKCLVWEIWSKSQNRVVWVTEGVDICLDTDDPHLSLEGFFPCPKPAYATTQRNSLIPVPDFLFYKDQVEEINELTARIAALSESVRLRGFYPAGAGEIGDAIEAAMKDRDERSVLIGVSNWAMVGQGAASDMIVWLPLQDVIATITSLIALRRQLIDDVYQITGLSDIMRGATVAAETLGAQQLKSQYGSVRIRDRQDELVRLARDLAKLGAEIMAEEFDGETLLAMSQMALRSDAEVKKDTREAAAKLRQMQADLQIAGQDPEIRQMVEQNPDQAQQVMQQAEEQIAVLEAGIEELAAEITIDKVMAFLKNQRLRPFVLDIETDSTIAPDEQAQKQRAAEFIEAVGGFMAQTVPLAREMPEAAPLASGMLKFVAQQYRAGRELQGLIEEFADNIAVAASAPKPDKPDPELVLAEAEAERARTDAQRAETEAGVKSAEAQRRLVEAQKALLAEQDKAEAKKLERQVDMQQQADRSAARQQEIADKAGIARLERERIEADEARSRARHAQDMELGALRITEANARLAGRSRLLPRTPDAG